MEQEAYLLMAGVEERMWWYVARRRIIDKIMNVFIATRPAPSQILEIGCGSGGNLPLLAKYGKLYAVEYDPILRDMAAQRKLCPILPATLPHPLPFDHPFDCICLFDVLEHIDERIETLNMLKPFLKNKAQNGTTGLLIMTVPAYSFLWTPHDDANHHKLRYTLTKMRAELSAAGYRIRYASYFNTLLFPLAAGFRLLRRWFGESKSSDFKIPTAPVNWVFTKIFAFEKNLLPRFRLPFGVSLIVVAEPVENSRLTTENIIK